MLGSNPWSQWVLPPLSILLRTATAEKYHTTIRWGLLSGAYWAGLIRRDLSEGAGGMQSRVLERRISRGTFDHRRLKTG